MKNSQFSFPQKRQPNFYERSNLVEYNIRSKKDRIPFNIEIETKDEEEHFFNNPNKCKYHKEVVTSPFFPRTIKDENSFLRELSCPISEEIKQRDLEMREKLLFLADLSHNLDRHNDENGIILQKVIYN
jgi:hypothetical protein